MYLKQIQLGNLRGFTDLRFDLSRPGGKYAGWTVLTGTGQDLTPFCDLRRTRPDVWQACTEGLLVSGPRLY